MKFFAASFGGRADPPVVQTSRLRGVRRASKEGHGTAAEETKQKRRKDKQQRKEKTDRTDEEEAAEGREKGERRRREKTDRKTDRTDREGAKEGKEKGGRRRTGRTKRGPRKDTAKWRQRKQKVADITCEGRRRGYILKESAPALREATSSQGRGHLVARHGPHECTGSQSGYIHAR